MHARCEALWLLVSPLLLRRKCLCVAAFAAHLLSRTIVEVLSKCFLNAISDVALVSHIHDAVSECQVHVAASEHYRPLLTSIGRLCADCRIALQLALLHGRTTLIRVRPLLYALWPLDISSDLLL